MDENSLKILFGALAGLIPLIAAAVINNAQSRSLRARRNDAIGIATQRVDFLTTWIASQESISPPEHYAQLKDGVQHELEDIKHDLDQLLAASQAVKRSAAEEHKSLAFWSRLFLMYRPYSIGGWVWHTLFYMACFIGIVFILTGLLAASPSESTFAYYVGYLIGIIIYLIPVFAVIVVTRLIAGYVDNRAVKKHVPTASASTGVAA